MMNWEEKYMGGSKEVEEQLFQELGERIKRIQKRVMEISARGSQVAGAPLQLQRGFHAKGTGVRARFRIADEIRNHKDLQTSLFRPGAEYDARVRFSNARSEICPDSKLDQRGVAIRVMLAEGGDSQADNEGNIQDFLMTNTPVSFAPDPIRFMEVGELLLEHSQEPPLQMLIKLSVRLMWKYGFRDAGRIMIKLSPPIWYQTWQTTQFWSRTPFKFNDYAVKFKLQPCEQRGRRVLSLFKGSSEPDYLKKRLEERLQQGDVRFDFQVQRFVDKEQTPIEDASKKWKTDFQTIAHLIIPKQRVEETLNLQIHRMAFDPWHTQDHRPLGSMNRARKIVYRASADERLRDSTTGKRQHVRVPAQFRSHFATKGQMMAGEGELRDFSPGGCKVRSPIAVALNVELELSIFAGDEARPFVIDGASVRWARNQEFGLAFTQIRPEGQGQVAQLYRRLAPPG